jgi:hypothetical protein
LPLTASSTSSSRKSVSSRKSAKVDNGSRASSSKATTGEAGTEDAAAKKAADKAAKAAAKVAAKLVNPLSSEDKQRIQRQGSIRIDNDLPVRLPLALSTALGALADRLPALGRS